MNELINNIMYSCVFQTLMNARQTLTTVTPPRSASTQQVATPAPALKDTGSLADSVRVSERHVTVKYTVRVSNIVANQLHICRQECFLSSKELLSVYGRLGKFHCRDVKCEHFISLYFLSKLQYFSY